jgi:hypothetical protein
MVNKHLLIRRYGNSFGNDSNNVSTIAVIFLYFSFLTEMSSCIITFPSNNTEIISVNNSCPFLLHHYIIGNTSFIRVVCVPSNNTEIISVNNSCPFLLQHYHWQSKFHQSGMCHIFIFSFIIVLTFF